jgi:hypothetical protein
VSACSGGYSRAGYKLDGKFALFDRQRAVSLLMSTERLSPEKKFRIAAAAKGE